MNRNGRLDNGLRQTLINLFVRNNADTFAKLENAVNTGDIRLAHRLAHTLKSNAGQLGHTALQQIAGDIEESLMNGESFTSPSQMEQLRVELDTFLAELAPLVRENAAPRTVELLDGKTALKVLNELEPLLREGDPECLSFIERLYLIPGSEELIDHIESFDFRLAAESLDELKKGL